MARRRRQEEHVNHEAWAIPYADLMTLLLAFFVVMYAISSLNEGKYRVLSESLTSAFTGTPRSVDPVQMGERQANDPDFGRPMPIPSAARHGSQVASPGLDSPLRPLLESKLRADRTGDDASAAARADSRRQLSRIAEQLEHELADLIRTRTVTLRRTDLWLEVEIHSDVLFDTASASLAAPAQHLLARLARLLRDQPNLVRVEGHTDSRPINTQRFPSNWELSAARAASVVHLFIREHVAPERLVMVGYGEHRPKADNNSVAGFDANRRVVLLVLASPDTPNARPADAPELHSTGEIPVATASLRRESAASQPGGR